VSVDGTSVWFPSPRAVELRREPMPPLGPAQIEVTALASAISHGTEMLVYRGQIPRGMKLDLPTLQGAYDFPIKYGYASVGRVEARGPAVDNIEVGDTVFVLHPHQDHYVVDASLATRLPAGVTPRRGVFLANLETAITIVLDAAPRLGERVVVFGQGVVGLLITQLLARLSLAELVVVEPVPARRALALRLGATAAVAPGERVADQDVAIEVSGQPAALDQALASVTFGGTIVVASWYGTKPVQLALGGPFHRRRLRLVSSQVSTIDGALQPRWTAARRLSLAADLLGKLELDALVSHALPLDRAAEAYRLVDEQSAETVQVVLTYGSPAA
jgi:2-desacetyl-2-hydroxyethyl bacteriochlorophyllide A dehydrogenase